MDPKFNKKGLYERHIEEKASTEEKVMRKSDEVMSEKSECYGPHRGSQQPLTSGSMERICS